VIKGGPPKNPDDIFERARQAGAQEGPVPVQLQPQLLFYVMALTNGQLNMSLSQASACMLQMSPLAALSIRVQKSCVDSTGRIPLQMQQQHCHVSVKAFNEDNLSCASLVSEQLLRGVQERSLLTG